MVPTARRISSKAEDPLFPDVISDDMNSPNPERWSVKAGSASQAQLLIPADLHRERRFEISCAMTVRAVDGASSPWHELKVFADGELQWRRRIDTQNPAPFDGLDYRFSCSVPPGRALRLQAYSVCAECRRLELTIEAEEPN